MLRRGAQGTVNQADVVLGLLQRRKDVGIFGARTITAQLGQLVRRHAVVEGRRRFRPTC